MAAKSSRNWNQGARDRLRSSLSKTPRCPQALTVAAGKLFSLKGPPCPQALTVAGGKLRRLVAMFPWPPLVLPFLSTLLSYLGQRPEVTERKAFPRALQI